MLEWFKKLFLIEKKIKSAPAYPGAIEMLTRLSQPDLFDGRIFIFSKHQEADIVSLLDSWCRGSGFYETVGIREEAVGIHPFNVAFCVEHGIRNFIASNVHWLAQLSLQGEADHLFLLHELSLGDVAGASALRNITRVQEWRHVLLSLLSTP